MRRWWFSIHKWVEFVIGVQILTWMIIGCTYHGRRAIRKNTIPAKGASCSARCRNRLCGCGNNLYRKVDLQGPDLIPIEQLFAKLKHCLRKATKRTIETVTTAIGEILGTSHPKEYAN